jgi:hypothetical protein
MGCSSSGRHLLEIHSLKDSRRWLFFFNEKCCLQKKRLPATKSVCLQFFCACNILSKADIKAQ